MKKILLRLYSIYGLLLFFLVTIPLVFLYILVSPLPDRQRTLAIMNMNRIVIRFWGVLVGIKMETIGMENLPSDLVCVIVGNHVNMLDIPLIGQAIMHYYKPLGKKEIIYVPIVGLIFAMTTILVNRSDAESRAESIETMIKWLKKGCSIVLFPEGTRNTTEEILKPFFDGAFRIAIEGQVPIVPMVLLNLKDMQPIHTWQLRPGTMTVEILPRIETVGMTEKDIPILKEKVYQIIENQLYEKDSFWKGKNKLA